MIFDVGHKRLTGYSQSKKKINFNNKPLLTSKCTSIFFVTSLGYTTNVKGTTIKNVLTSHSRVGPLTVTMTVLCFVKVVVFLGSTPENMGVG